MTDKDWFVLDKESQLCKLEKLLEETHLIEMSGESIFVRLGYHILSPGDKETYYFMRDLTLLSRYKFKKDLIDPSLDYLAKCLGTTIRTQINRINNLEKYKLLKKTKRKYKSNAYAVNTQPLPDSTFVSTLVILIRRKRILDKFEQYKKTEDNLEKEIVFQELQSYNEHPAYQKLIVNLSGVKELLTIKNLSF